MSALGHTLAAQEGAVGNRVGDAMVTCPKTHSPESSVEEIRALLDDDHVHIALIVATDGRLVTTIERSDLAAATSSSTPVAELGTLVGRTVGPSYPLDAATAALSRDRRRRLAVVDHSGRLLGLLCLKRDGKGYCTDEGIRARENEAEQKVANREAKVMASVLNQHAGSAGPGAR
jgi:CBS-domain-containing membrane protein